MAETRCKYYKQKRQVSYDGGATWQDVIPYQYQRGELYEYESSDCGAVIVYRWVNMDASVDYYCEGTTKYYKQKKQVSYDGGQTWIDVSPAEYQKGGVAEQRSTDCGYVPPTPQYRWIKSDDTICVEPQYRWVNMDASVDYYCEGTTKYYKQKKQVSNNGGQTWQDVTPPVYQRGGVAEEQSTDCGYVPPTPKKFVANYYNGTTREIECNSSTELTSGETRPSGFNYRKMSNAVIGDCVTTIGEEAFEYCDGLTSVTIPNSVTSIGRGAFYMSSRLTSIDIPNSVTSIGKGAFANCSGLTSLNIGNSVTTIGNLAFEHCTGLTSVSIPNSVTSIGEEAFDWCTSLTSVTIPNSVTTIGGWAFMYCSGLTSVNIPDSVTSIGMSAFNYCSGLTSITVEATTPPTLEPYAFDNTNNCNVYVPCQSVDAYKSAENWNTYASRIQGIPPCGETSKKLVANYRDGETLEVDCNGDGTLTSGETQPSGYEKNRMTNAVIGNCVTIIGDNAFYGCGITSVTIPNSVTTIGFHAFIYCSDLTGVTIPNSVTTILNGAFGWCSGFTFQSVVIPNSVTEIDGYAFAYCTNLTSCTIGNSVTTIGGGAFESCRHLTSVTVNAITPPTLGGYAFLNNARGRNIYVPAESVDAYKAASGWSEYADRIQAIP